MNDLSFFTRLTIWGIFPRLPLWSAELFPRKRWLKMNVGRKQVRCGREAPQGKRLEQRRESS
jgi:hypothetical protein